MAEMTTHERMARMLEHREADRVPVTDSPWGATVERWRREGMQEGVDISDFFGMDKFAQIGANNSPRYPVETVEETDEYKRKGHFTLVYGLDLANGKVLFHKRYPGRAFTGLCAYDHTSLVRGPDGCGWLFVGEALCRIHPDGTLERVREPMPYRGKMLWRGSTLTIYNGGRVYNRLFANVVRIPDLLAKPQ